MRMLALRTRFWNYLKCPYFAQILREHAMKLPRLLILPAWTTLLALVSCDWLFAQAEPVPVARLIYKTVVPTGQKEASIWRHTFAQPAANWFKPGFDDA